MKAWIAYINDDGPSIAAFLDEETCREFCWHLTRILHWRSDWQNQPDTEDAERVPFPPDDFEPEPVGRRSEWTITYFDLDIPQDLSPRLSAIAYSADFSEWGEHEP